MKNLSRKNKVLLKKQSTYQICDCQLSIADLKTEDRGQRTDFAACGGQKPGANQFGLRI